MSPEKERIDKLLLDRGLVDSRSKSQAVIMAGEVLVDGEPVTKAGQKVPVDSHIELQTPPPFVSRGGIKLSAALDKFPIDVTGQTCADVGACTGGFTDVLLQRNAAKVYAIDVGYGQLDWRLRQDCRVVVMERTNARYLEQLDEQVAIIVIDVSFISLRLILPAAVGWLEPDGDIICLVKPQFEAGREKVGKGGIVRDPRVRHEVLSQLIDWCIQHDLQPAGLIRSPITGSSGNVEFVLWLKVGQATVNEASALLETVELE